MSATLAANRTLTPSVTADRTALLSFVLGVTRLAMGWTFLWPFLDKAFGLGHETASADAWVNGGSPTSGFLGHATKGPFADTYQSFAGHAWVDWLFMLGLLGIGTALILGAAMRLAVAAGSLLFFLMWTAVLPPQNNLFLDDHLIYILILVVLALSSGGRTLGLGPIWERLPIVKRNAILR